ncbi:hypothetical protein HDU67_007397 [Dinochytrium kinnereticum]|nr:hypothetical protein HDU67_007397 [Dinochytrium kinnereticum]
MNALVEAVMAPSACGDVPNNGSAPCIVTTRDFTEGQGNESDSDGASVYTTPGGDDSDASFYSISEGSESGEVSDDDDRNPLISASSSDGLFKASTPRTRASPFSSFDKASKSSTPVRSPALEIRRRADEVMEKLQKTLSRGTTPVKEFTMMSPKTPRSPLSDVKKRAEEAMAKLESILSRAPTPVKLGMTQCELIRIPKTSVAQETIAQRILVADDFKGLSEEPCPPSKEKVPNIFAETFAVEEAGSQSVSEESIIQATVFAEEVEGPCAVPCPLTEDLVSSSIAETIVVEESGSKSVVDDASDQTIFSLKDFKGPCEEPSPIEEQVIDTIIDEVLAVEEADDQSVAKKTMTEAIFMAEEVTGPSEQPSPFTDEPVTKVIAETFAVEEAGGQSFADTITQTIFAAEDVEPSKEQVPSFIARAFAVQETGRQLDGKGPCEELIAKDDKGPYEETTPPIKGQIVNTIADKSTFRQNPRFNITQGDLSMRLSSDITFNASAIATAESAATTTTFSGSSLMAALEDGVTSSIPNDFPVFSNGCCHPIAPSSSQSSLFPALDGDASINFSSFSCAPFRSSALLQDSTVAAFDDRKALTADILSSLASVSSSMSSSTTYNSLLPALDDGYSPTRQNLNISGLGSSATLSFDYFSSLLAGVSMPDLTAFGNSALVSEPSVSNPAVDYLAPLSSDEAFLSSFPFSDPPLSPSNALSWDASFYAAMLSAGLFDSSLANSNQNINSPGGNLLTTMSNQISSGLEVMKTGEIVEKNGENVDNFYEPAAASIGLQLTTSSAGRSSLDSTDSSLGLEEVKAREECGIEGEAKDLTGTAAAVLQDALIDNTSAIHKKFTQTTFDAVAEGDSFVEASCSIEVDKETLGISEQTDDSDGKIVFEIMNAVDEQECDEIPVEEGYCDEAIISTEPYKETAVFHVDKDKSDEKITFKTIDGQVCDEILVEEGDCYKAMLLVESDRDAAGDLPESDTFAEKIVPKTRERVGEHLPDEILDEESVGIESILSAESKKDSKRTKADPDNCDDKIVQPLNTIDKEVRDKFPVEEDVFDKNIVAAYSNQQIEGVNADSDQPDWSSAVKPIDTVDEEVCDDHLIARSGKVKNVVAGSFVECAENTIEPCEVEAVSNEETIDFDHTVRSLHGESEIPGSDSAQYIAQHCKEATEETKNNDTLSLANTLNTPNDNRKHSSLNAPIPMPAANSIFEKGCDNDKDEIRDFTGEVVFDKITTNTVIDASGPPKPCTEDRKAGEILESACDSTQVNDIQVKVEPIATVEAEVERKSSKTDMLVLETSFAENEDKKQKNDDSLGTSEVYAKVESSTERITVQEILTTEDVARRVSTRNESMNVGFGFIQPCKEVDRLEKTSHCIPFAMKLSPPIPFPFPEVGIFSATVPEALFSFILAVLMLFCSMMKRYGPGLSRWLSSVAPEVLQGIEKD